MTEELKFTIPLEPFFLDYDQDTGEDCPPYIYEEQRFAASLRNGHVSLTVERKIIKSRYFDDQGNPIPSEWESSPDEGTGLMISKVPELIETLQRLVKVNPML